MIAVYAIPRSVFASVDAVARGTREVGRISERRGREPSDPLLQVYAETGDEIAEADLKRTFFASRQRRG